MDPSSRLRGTRRAPAPVAHERSTRQRSANAHVPQVDLASETHLVCTREEIDGVGRRRVRDRLEAEPAIERLGSVVVRSQANHSEARASAVKQVGGESPRDPETPHCAVLRALLLDCDVLCFTVLRYAACAHCKQMRLSPN